MIPENELIWIEAGYRIFAFKGPGAVKIELLAREVGISKSSFYHHFADLGIFNEKMMALHIMRGSQIAAQAKLCKSFDPDFLKLLAANSEDLLFNRQLRIHRNNIAYQLCFERANAMVETAILDVWAATIGLSEHKHIARNVFNVMSDIFYNRVTHETISYEWMQEFLTGIYAFLNDIIRSSGIMSAETKR